ncbi:MAG: CRISPR system precrRNA processing endoribonuclease RAMP protein Cas6 [Candidatus Latescibacterota bacterium]
MDGLGATRPDGGLAAASAVPGLPPSPQALFGDLPLVRLRLGLEMAGRGGLSEHLGSALRGVFGWELQRLVCPFPRRPACASCVIRRQCPYVQLLEDGSTLPGLADTPRPYGISSERGGPGIRLTVTLFGRACAQAPVVVAAFAAGGRRGLGRRRLPYRLLAVEALLPGGGTRPLPLAAETLPPLVGPAPLAVWLETSPPAGPVCLRLLTPLRLRRQGKYLGAFDGPFLLETTARRLEALHVLHHGGSPVPAAVRDQLRALFATFVPEGVALRWQDLVRQSSRQPGRQPLGGLVGTVRARIEPAIGAWLAAASLAGAGKGTVMGLGRLAVEAAE